MWQFIEHYVSSSVSAMFGDITACVELNRVGILSNSEQFLQLYVTQPTFPPSSQSQEDVLWCTYSMFFHTMYDAERMRMRSTNRTGHIFPKSWYLNPRKFTHLLVRWLTSRHAERSHQRGNLATYQAETRQAAVFRWHVKLMKKICDAIFKLLFYYVNVWKELKVLFWPKQNWWDERRWFRWVLHRFTLEITKKYPTL